MITVLHVITGLESGGAERMLVRVATGRRHQDVRQIVVSLMGEGVHGAGLRAAGVELHCLDVTRGFSALLAPLRLARILRRCRPDVIMTWLYHADLAGTLAALISGLGARRVVWNLRCSDVDFSQYAPTTRWIVSVLARLSGLPAAVAANSQAGREHHARLGYRPRRWIDLPNGFDFEEWRPDADDRRAVRAEWGLDERAIVVGMVARVDPSKDHGTFFDAANRLVPCQPDTHFVLIGRGTERLAVPPELQRRVLLLSERTDVSRLVRGFDIAVLSSLTEGFPNVVGEAMASGVPCVVTDVGDAANIVGDTGELVPPRSSEALARSIARMAKEPDEMRRRRGEAARERIVGRFGLEPILGQYRDAWRSVMEDHRPRGQDRAKGLD